MTSGTQTLIHAALANKNFRKVVHTGISSQHTVMHIEVGKEIGRESHDADQTFIIASGSCVAIINGKEKFYTDGDVFFVDGGEVHNVINNGDTALKLISIYSPPIHIVDEINRTSKDETTKTIIDTLQSLLKLKKNSVLNIIFWNKNTIPYVIKSSPHLTKENDQETIIDMLTDRGNISIIWKEKRRDSGSILTEDNINYEILQLWT